jgi:hypothetical protein
MAGQIHAVAGEVHAFGFEQATLQLRQRFTEQ